MLHNIFILFLSFLLFLIKQAGFETRACRWLGKRGETTGRLGGAACATLWTDFRLFAFFELVDDTHSRLWRQVFVVVVVDLHHWRVGTRTQTLDLNQRKFFIFGRF